MENTIFGDLLEFCYQTTYVIFGTIFALKRCLIRLYLQLSVEQQVRTRTTYVYKLIDHDMNGKRHIDGILLFDAAIVWYIYIQYMKALELDTETFCHLL
jgi:hypothetical protein